MRRDRGRPRREREKAYREMGREVLRILNEPDDLRDSIKRIISALKTRTGFDAVGIRLQDGDDFPYSAQKGFSDEFLSTENTLIARGKNGRACRDEAGRIKLACTCGLVLSGKTGPADPILTPGGSFWTNDSLPLLQTPSREDSRHPPRNVCIRQGYASVALVPIRSKEKIVGLIQLNDRRKGCFTPETVELTEEIAASIGTALARKQREDSLREREEKYRTVFENGFDAVLFVDGQTHRIERVNAAASGLYGYTKEEFLALTVEDISAQPEKTRENVIKVGTGQIKGIILGRRHKKKDGTDFQAEIATARCVIDGRVKVIESVRDVSGHLRDAQAIARASAETDRLREREQMTMAMMANVSHEMRTPLAAIKGFAETLRSGGLEDAKNRLAFVQMIENHANRLSFLIEDMLLLTDLDNRATAPVFEALDLAGFVAECVKGLGPIIEANGIPLTVDVPPRLKVRADADRLTRVIHNLLGNALKYNRRGGRVEIGARADGTEAVVTVRDTGRGIPREDLARIFGRFYRSRATKHIPGTGLGLPIVKAIVELHGGRIWAESVYGKGSAFHFTLPLTV